MSDEFLFSSYSYSLHGICINHITGIIGSWVSIVNMDIGDVLGETIKGTRL